VLGGRISHCEVMSCSTDFIIGTRMQGACDISITDMNRNVKQQSASSEPSPSADLLRNRVTCYKSTKAYK
jgi:hypothetical protein